MTDAGGQHRDEPTRTMPTAPAPTVTTAPAEGARRWWAAIPRRLGRARTSTVVLAVLFVAIGVLYLYVRPETTGTSPAGDTGDVAVVPTPAPETTTPPAPTTTAPSTSARPTTSAPPSSEAPDEGEEAPAPTDDTGTTAPETTDSSTSEPTRTSTTTRTPTSSAATGT